MGIAGGAFRELATLATIALVSLAVSAFLKTARPSYLWGVATSLAALVTLWLYSKSALIIPTIASSPEVHAILISPAVEEAYKTSIVYLALRQRLDLQPAIAFGCGYAVIESSYKVFSLVDRIRQVEWDDQIVTGLVVLFVTPFSLLLVLSLVTFLLRERRVPGAVAFLSTFTLHAMYNLWAVLESPVSSWEGLFLSASRRVALLAIIGVSLSALIRRNNREREDVDSS